MLDPDEVALAGGDVTEGVVRVGDTVRRTIGPHSALVHEVLAHLERVGFAGAPRFLGVDERGREVLTYLEGEVAGRPWPDWVADTDRIVGVAELVRALDDAMLPWAIPQLAWPSTPEPPGTPMRAGPPPAFVGHRDVTPENVVFREGRAAALIDFDLAGPASRVDEVCNLLLWWAPLMPPADREAAVRDVDAVARAAVLVDAYGMSDEDRGHVAAVAAVTAERTWFLMRDRAQRLGGGWRRMWEEGVGDRILQRQTWLADHTAALDEAVTGRTRAMDRDMEQVTFTVVAPSSPGAVWAMTQYFDELARRFPGGFDVAGGLADASTAFVPPAGWFVLAGPVDAPVACGGVQLMDDERGEIKRMWVAPSSRGQGLASRLLGHLEDGVRSAGRTTVVLDTNSVLTEAITMYERRGYRRIDRYNDNPYAHLWFAKTLAAEG